MNKRKPLRWCVCVVVLVAAIACGDGPVTPNPTVRSLSVTPKTVSVLLGRTVAVTATVEVDGGASNAVTWSSSNEAVASVAADGIVTGHQVGEAAITATSTFDPTKKDVASVSVILGEPASVAIQSVNRGGTPFPVDPSGVSGTVDVNLNVSPGDQLLTRIDLLVDNVVVASQDFQASLLSLPPPFAPAISGAPFSVTLSFTTAAFNPVTGIPLFLNSAHTLTARVSMIGGVVAATMQLTFANQNTIIATISTNGSQASDAAGRVWVSGDLTVTARPVIYTSGSITLASAVIGFPGLQNKTAGANGVVSWSRSILPNDGGVGGYSNNGGIAALAPVVVSSILSNGAAGPSGAPANASQIAIRLDNRAPHPGAVTLTTQSALTPCCSGGWVGNAYLFANGHSPLPGDGEGVDGAGIGANGVTYHAGDPALTNEQIIALPAVTSSATLTQSLFSNAYTLVARVSDRVGNVSATRLVSSPGNPVTTFGVDKFAPSFAFSPGTVADGAINPVSLVFVTTGQDEASGFAPQPVVHRIFGNFSTSLCFLGGPSCTPVLGGFVIASSAIDGFYFTYEAFVRDQAGNASQNLTRTVLFDQQPPQVTAMPVPTLSAAPTLTQFSVSVADNVDLKSAEHRLDFPGASGPLASLPFSQPAVLGTFGAPLSTVQNNVVVSIPFVRSLEQTTGANLPTGTLQATEGTRFRITDQAGNVTHQSALFPGGSVPPGTIAALLDLQTFRISAPLVPVAVCSGVVCGAVPQTIQISAEATGPSTFNLPFSAVYFYWVDSFGTTRLIAFSSSPEAQSIGGVFRWTWTVNFSAPGAPTQAAVQVFAIGVDGAGDGLRSRTITNLSIIGGG